MRPTTLRVQGLKSWKDRTLELGQLTAIQGPNGSGKTALIQALRIAILGYDPETGKQLGETRKLLNPAAAEIQVALSFDNGFGIVRKLGKKTETLVVPPRGETTGRDCQARIDTETGGLLVTLNLGVFLELSDDKRREWLFQHLPQDAAVLDWETFADWTDGETDELKPVVATLWKDNVTSAPNPVVGLGSAIEVAKRQFLEADRERQNQGKVVARGEEKLRLLEEPETVAPGALDDLERRLATTNQRIGTARAGAEAVETIEKRRDAAAEKLGGTMRELEHVEGVRADLVQQIKNHPEAPDTLELEGQVGALEAEVERARVAHAKEKKPLEDARALAARVLGARDVIERQQGEGCPFASVGCETEVGELVAEALAGVNNELEVAVAKREAAKVTEQARSVALGDVGRELNRVREEIKAAEKIRSDHGDLEKSSAHQGVVMQELRERAGIYRTEMEEAAAELGPASSTEALEAAYAERDELAAAIAALNVDLRAAQKHGDRLERQREEEEEHERLRARAVTLKELDGNLRRLRGHVIQTMIAPLEYEARAILSAIDPAKTFVFRFERENRSIMDFGFEEDGSLRFYDAASKGERVMLVVAFVGALLKVLAPPMRLLVIDDLEQLYGAHRLGLLRGIAKLRDHFDAVIVAGACDFRPDLPPEWDFVDLQDDLDEEAAVA